MGVDCILTLLFLFFNPFLGQEAFKSLFVAVLTIVKTIVKKLLGKYYKNFVEKIFKLRKLLVLKVF